MFPRRLQAAPASALRSCASSRSGRPTIWPLPELPDRLPGAYPRLGAERRNEAKRFVLLIDTLYDGKVRLVATSGEAPESIYPEGDHAIEFGRTVSRLKEMQSASWWGKKIAET